MPSHMMIGLDDLSECLYKRMFEDNVSKVLSIYVSDSSSIPTNALWHLRLG